MSNSYNERPTDLTLEKLKSYTAQKIKSLSVQLKDLGLTNMIYLHVLDKAKVKFFKKYTNQLFKLFSVAYLITLYNSLIFNPLL